MFEGRVGYKAAIIKLQYILFYIHNNALIRCLEEFKKNKFVPAEEAEKQEKEQRKKEIERLKNIRNNKIKTLTQNGVDSYYEYTSLTIVDDYSGSFDIEHTISKINELALEGWRLKATITNEIGKNSSQFGVGGFSSGTNATIEQTTFILERKVAIQKN